MSIDIGFITAALYQGTDAFTEAMEQGVSVELFQGDGRTHLEFLATYYARYGALPTLQVVQERYPNFRPHPAPGEVKFYIDELKNRRLYNLVAESLQTMAAKMGAKDAQGAYDEAGALLAKGMEVMGGLEQVNLARTGAQREKLYEMRKANPGLLGMETPWESLNTATDGWQKGDYIPITARMNVGKTQVLLLIQNHAHDQGCKVLTVSLEMSIEQVSRRVDGMRIPANPRLIRRGNLPTPQEDIHRMRLAEFGADWWVIGPSKGLTVSRLETLIQTLKPDVVGIDGVYMMADEDKGRTREERLTNISRRLKSMSARTGVVTFVTTQLNRGAADKEGELQDIGYTDAFGQDGDIVVSLHQTKDMKDDKLMSLNLLKYREGGLDSIQINWDFEKMDFSEVPRAPSQAQQDAEAATEECSIPLSQAASWYGADDTSALPAHLKGESDDEFFR